MDFYQYFISVQDCKEDEFKCKDMTCIPNHKYCDDISDCPDSSDEMSCPTTTVSQQPDVPNVHFHLACQLQIHWIIYVLVYF